MKSSPRVGRFSSVVLIFGSGGFYQVTESRPPMLGRRLAVCTQG